MKRTFDAKDPRDLGGRLTFGVELLWPQTSLSRLSRRFVARTLLHATPPFLLAVLLIANGDAQDGEEKRYLVWVLRLAANHYVRWVKPIGALESGTASSRHG